MKVASTSAWAAGPDGHAAWEKHTPLEEEAEGNLDNGRGWLPFLLSCQLLSFIFFPVFPKLQNSLASLFYDSDHKIFRRQTWNSRVKIYEESTNL